MRERKRSDSVLWQKPLHQGKTKQAKWHHKKKTPPKHSILIDIDSIGNLTSPACQSVNFLKSVWPNLSRRHRSHGSRKYKKPEIHNASFDGLLPFVNFQLGLHHIRTRLYSLPLNMLHDLYESIWPYISPMLHPQNIDFRVLFWTFPQTGFSKLSGCVIILRQKNRPFLKMKFANKGIDALNLSNILNQKSVQSNIPPYFQNKESSCVSYSYTRSVASKIFNYKRSRVQ